MTERELLQRTKQFALRIFKLVVRCPKRFREEQSLPTDQERHVGGANYRAACRARSKPEFVAKLGVVEEEADESAFWLELIMRRLAASKVSLC